MDYKTTVSTLFFLLVHADGNLSEKEIVRGKQMMQAEGIAEGAFNSLMERLKLKDKDSILADCIAALKKFNHTSQIKCIAWLCVVANADGFMDKKEWMLIYKIYHTELNLQLDEIMKIQKDLNKIIHGREFHSMGVKMS